MRVHVFTYVIHVHTCNTCVHTCNACIYCTHLHVVLYFLQCQSKYCELPIECVTCGEFLEAIIFQCIHSLCCCVCGLCTSCHYQSDVLAYFKYLSNFLYLSMFSPCLCLSSSLPPSLSLTSILYSPFSYTPPSPIGITLVLAPQLARSYHHLFPLQMFKESTAAQ